LEGFTAVLRLYATVGVTSSSTKINLITPVSPLIGRKLLL
jgi:hypothetical protein